MHHQTVPSIQVLGLVMLHCNLVTGPVGEATAVDVGEVAIEDLGEEIYAACSTSDDSDASDEWGMGSDKRQMTYPPSP